MIVVAGEALVDLVVGSDGSVISALGGAPFNTARTCGRLGAEVSFAGAVSNDRFGTLLAAELEASGVALDPVQRVDAPTTLAAAEIDDVGVAAYRFYVAGTSAPALVNPAMPATVDVLVTGGLGLVLEPMATTIEQIVSAADEETLVFLDVNCRPLVIDDRERYVGGVDRVAERSDVVKVSDEDLDYLHPGLDVRSAAERLLRLGPSVVLVTRGAQGVNVVSHGDMREVPVASVDVLDTIGAGDAFGGGFLAWWVLSGRSRTDLDDLDVVERAVAAANAVAGVVCTRRGADPPWRDELPDDWSS
ncbi:MAG TPA: PfkB family carbohydrate kinase [Ilumatobacteraceae bacterium]